jgi:two-component system alkaline phosphatase synthesis response regulator PhoP
MTRPPRILLVEDEPDVQLIVSDMLRARDYEVLTASDGDAGLRMVFESGPFDLLILDVMLPGLNGFAICHLARQGGFDGAILMLTARFDVDDRVHGLQEGADDYLVKPFENKELLARVAALLRRVRKHELTPVLRFEFGAVIADFSRGEVTRAGESVALSIKELKLLRFLIDRRGQTVTREQLLSSIWSEQPFITPRTVDVHVAWLRNKLEEDPRNPRFIQTVRGEGYRFERV